MSRSPANCARCGRRVGADPRFPVAVGHDRCAHCTFRAAARAHLGDRRRWAELRDLFLRQDGRCAYTGAVLTLGTATVDHRLPRALGGTSEADNLQWVTGAVNAAKGRLTHAEFLALCREVSECFVRPPASLP